MCVTKRCKYITLKNDSVWVVFRMEEIQGNDNENRIEEREEKQKIENYNAFHIRAARSLYSLCTTTTYLLLNNCFKPPS